MGKHYDKEFKMEAVRLACEPGNTQAAIEKDLGIGQGVISRWKREFERDGEQAFPGKAPEMGSSVLYLEGGLSQGSASSSSVATIGTPRIPACLEA